MCLYFSISVLCAKINQYGNILLLFVIKNKQTIFDKKNDWLGCFRHFYHEDDRLTHIPTPNNKSVYST